MKYINSIFFVLVLIIFCAAINPARAQNNSQNNLQSIPQNLSNVNVNELSDNQIVQLLQQAQAAGLTDDQLLQQAQNRGMAPDQVQILQKRITTIRQSSTNGINNTKKGFDTLSSQSRKLNYRLTDTIADTSTRMRDVFNNLQPKIFGADLFKNKSLTFEPNLRLATPVNYIIGPEDQLIISIYGNSDVNWKLDVSTEGNINIPGSGIINVSGKTIEQATAIIRNKLVANHYSIGKGTSIQVSLGNIRSIKVIIVGEVAKPGTYTLPSLATVFNALYLAGGPNENGSFRQIEVIRNNHIIQKLDIYDFLLKGEQKSNIRLEDQDVIRIPTYRIRVEMAGEIKRPALFEVMPGETLQNVLDFAGGFTDKAYTALIKVSQVSDQQMRLTDVTDNDFKNYIPLRGDKYVVEHILNRFENRITINGAVFRPGQYELQKGMTLSQLIKKAAGIKEDAFTGRGSLLRLKPDNSREQLSFNVVDIINNKATDIPLQREDSVVISSIFDLRVKYKVTIKGEVRKPGEFAYADSMTVADLIIRAGGLTEGGSSKRLEVSRRVYDSDPRVKDSRLAQVYNIDLDENFKAGNANFVLQPFDVVSLYSLPGYEIQKTVKVEGEVVYPGYYTIRMKNEKISDIVVRAGGLTASADVEGSSLKRENIAVLGTEKNKTDTAALLKERKETINRLKRSFKDSTNTDTTQLRNNYIGIDLKRILDKPGAANDLILENGDVLRVPKKQQIVRVNGEVLFPSAIVYENKKSFKDYILNAGGFSQRALRRSAYIVYPNGTVRGTSKKFLFFNSRPDVRPGSEIVVPVKPEPKGNSAQTILGFTTGFASLGAIILGILSLHK